MVKIQIKKLFPVLEQASLLVIIYLLLKIFKSQKFTDFICDSILKIKYIARKFFSRNIFYQKFFMFTAKKICKKNNVKSRNRRNLR
jgi:hypothetical protein